MEYEEVCELQYKKYLNSNEHASKKKSLAKLAASKQLPDKISLQSSISSIKEKNTGLCVIERKIKITGSHETAQNAANFQHNEDREYKKDDKAPLLPCVTISHKKSSMTHKSNSLSTSFKLDTSIEKSKLQSCSSFDRSEKDLRKMDDKKPHISSFIGQENTCRGEITSNLGCTDLDIKSMTATSLTSSSELVSEADRSVISVTENRSAQGKGCIDNSEKVSSVENNESNISDQAATGHISRKEKLLGIHAHDEVVISGDDGESSSDGEFVGGVYCGPKQSRFSSGPEKVTKESDMVRSNGNLQKTSSGTNLSRNHSLKYSGGALHDDRNPLSFDHTFCQPPNQSKCKSNKHKLGKIILNTFFFEWPKKEEFL